MLKFLRKYDKWILAIGGSLLMVAFLLPQALQRLGGDPRNRVVATFDGGSVTARERIEANTRMRTVAAVVGPYMQQLGITDPDHWIMLEAEARRGGFVGGPETGRAYFAEAARAAGVDADAALATVTASMGLNVDTALRAMAVFAGIDRMRLVHLQAPRLSEPEILDAYEKTVERVGLHAALVPAESLLGTVSEFPVAEQLEAFFEAHKNTPRGAGKLDFGYRVEPAIKFEWLEILPSSIEEAVPIDPVDMNARWRANRELYTGEDFSADRERVEQDMRLEKATTLIGDMGTLIKSEIARARRDGTAIDLRELAADIARRLSQREGFAVPEMTYAARTDRWQTLTNLRSTPRVRNARWQSGQTATSLPQALLTVREIDPSDPYDIGVGEILGPITTSAGSQLYVRVTEARPQGAPESLEVVKDRVVADFRLQKAWDALRERAARFPAQIKARGLATVAADAGGSFVGGIRTTPTRLVPPASRDIDTQTFGRLNKPEFCAAVVEKAAGIDPVGDVRGLPVEDRTVVVELPAEAVVGLAEIISVDPITKTGFRLATEQTIRSLEQQRLFAVFTDSPFSFDRMKARLHYRREGGGNDEEEPTETVADGGAG